MTQTHAAPDLVAHRVLFRPPAGWVDDELYFTVHGTDGHDGAVDAVGRTGLTLRPHTLVRADTYFGRFRASHWQRWTEVPSVTLRAVADPGIRVVACTEDIGGHVGHAGSAEVPADADGPREIAVEVPLAMYADGGAIHARISSGEVGGAVRDVRFTVGAEHVVRDIPTDIVICTYNRPGDCANTVATLARDPEALQRVRAVRVVDQGDRHPADEADFAAAAEVLGQRLVVVEQPNLGGAGGFSRGMRDATAAGDCLVLLTDDDIRPEPETTLRLSAIACCTAKPMLFGAQMLFLYNPTHLFRTGETFDWGSLSVGLNDPLYGQSDVDVRENHQLRRLGVDYNAWWSCLVPSEVVEDIGLALPLFFQYDDIDFGFRAREAGYPTETLPGAAVWHADFYWKDVDSPAGYFSLRNGLIATGIHGGRTGRQMAATVGRMIGSNIVSMRYGLAAIQLEAVRDALSGPDVLDDASAGDFGRAAALRAAHPETRLLPMSELPADLRPVRPPTREIASVDKVLAKRAAYTQMGKARPGPVAIAYEDAFWWHISAFDDVWVTDGSQSGVRHLVRDRDRELALRDQLAGVLRRVVKEWDGHCRRWSAAAPGLASPANWARHFGE
ncbi:glycosyltransferase [Corynebacterium sp.]|uniref:glycosyltransferase n=1 Tax=Corynebacterium sp. TaxID=1720 RepID=UPI0026DC4733|nr:glycosyltransferase [Corynebacterium sp.]MDO4609595.1 glycosyltransferase [Corynebacterium sp.]